MNFKELLDIRGIENHASDDKPNEINICCPFCFDQGETLDTRFRLGINVKKNVAYCFNCSWASRHDTIDKVLKKLEIEKENIEELTSRIEEKKEFDGQLPKSFELLWPLKKDKDFRKAYHYLRDRGISDRQIEKYQIGFCLAGPYSNRIILPIFRKDKLYGYIGRDFTGKQFLRYKNSKGKKTLYGVPEKKSDVAMLVEGAIDKLSGERVLSQYGVDVIGIPGRVLRDKDLKLLKHYKKIIRVPDMDRPGLKGALKDLKKLKEAEFNVYVSFMNPKFKDINNAYVNHGKKYIVRLFTHAELFTWAIEIKIKSMLATDYRGVQNVS
jgi:DNA primase